MLLREQDSRQARRRAATRCLLPAVIALAAGLPAMAADHPAAAADRWTHVALVLEGAEPAVQPGRMKLYVNDQLVGTAPGVRMPKSYTPPRLGQPAANRTGAPLTRFMRPLVKGERAAPFKGRLDDFLMLNAAERPRDREQPVERRGTAALGCVSTRGKVRFQQGRI